MDISFQPIDFPTQFDTFFKIRIDANIETLGRPDFTKNQARRYVKKNLEMFGELAFLHMYVNGRMIGQMELSSRDSHGYVHLFYILPQFRNKGFFKYMHSKMLEIMQAKGYVSVILSTPPSNIAAICIYQPFGWQEFTYDTLKPGMLGFILHIPTYLAKIPHR